MTCHNCGHKLNDDAMFCSNCRKPQVIADSDNVEKLSQKAEEDRPSNNGYKEETLSDKIGDDIVDGIQTVTDIICAPFEWLTDKLTGL
jgi:hypothetical protein